MIMKALKNSIKALMFTLMCASCTSLDLNPLDEPSSATWYADENQLELALNAVLYHGYWPQERVEFKANTSVMDMDEISDDMMRRNAIVSFKNGTLASSQTACEYMWKNTYAAITLCNNILVNMTRLKDKISEERYNAYEGCARFYRACLYARIMMLYGDPVYFEKDLSLLSDAYTIRRTPLETALSDVYKDFDFAIANCPVAWSGVNRATKGAAYAMKARLALYMASVYKFDDNPANDPLAASYYEIARDCAKGCMDLEQYRLYPDYGELFLSKTRNACESIFCIPRSVTYAEGDKRQLIQGTSITAVLPIGIGGNISEFPTLDLFFSYLCTDGKTIDKSPLFDPKDPFKNRDPRLAESIVPWGTDFCGIVYDPRFNVSQVWDSAQNKYVTNPDNIVTASEARLPSRTMLVQKKGIDKDWTDDMQTDPDKIIMRYADVLLMYAEAKIELGEIDATVLDAMNQVRARAYGVDASQTDAYPAISETGQAGLRTILRTERRMEFAFERLRVYDIHRWRISEKVLNYSDWCIKYNAGNDVLQEAMKNDGGIFPTPVIDSDGCPVMDKDYNSKGYPWLVNLYNRSFNPKIHYLWPIPANDVLVNDNLDQNLGY